MIRFGWVTLKPCSQPFPILVIFNSACTCYFADNSYAEKVWKLVLQQLTGQLE